MPTPRRTPQPSFFDTLNDALESEGLLQAWDVSFPGLAYGDTYTWTWQDGSRYGRFISVYRDNNGRYERPVHYKR